VVAGEPSPTPLMVRKNISEAKRSDWQDSKMKPLDRREFLNTGKDSFPHSGHNLLHCMILVTRGNSGARVCYWVRVTHPRACRY